MRVRHLSRSAGNVPFAGAMNVSKVDGELKERMAEPLVELVESLERIDEHAGFGLEGELDVSLLGVAEQRFYCLDQAVHPCVVVNGIGSTPGPKRDTFGLEDLGQVDGAAKKVEPDGAARGVGVHEGWVVLHPRVEQIARTGLDDACHPVAVEGRPDRAQLATQDRRIFERVECAGVECDRNTLIAFVGQEIDCIEQSVVSQAVGIVAESHQALAHEGR